MNNSHLNRGLGNWRSHDLTDPVGARKCRCINLFHCYQPTVGCLNGGFPAFLVKTDNSSNHTDNLTSLWCGFEHRGVDSLETSIHTDIVVLIYSPSIAYYCSNDTQCKKMMVISISRCSCRYFCMSEQQMVHTT